MDRITVLAWGDWDAAPLMRAGVSSTKYQPLVVLAYSAAIDAAAAVEPRCAFRKKYARPLRVYFTSCRTRASPCHNKCWLKDLKQYSHPHISAVATTVVAAAGPTVLCLRRNCRTGNKLDREG